jgi:hypothetical protein
VKNEIIGILQECYIILTAIGKSNVIASEDGKCSSRAGRAKCAIEKIGMVC